MTELKPCPFCGAAASAWEWNGGARVDCSKWRADAYSVHTHYVGIGARTMEEAIELWNRRAEQPPAQPEQRWIPCSERLPEEDNVEVLCTVKQQSKTDRSETIIVEQGCYFYGTWLLSYDYQRVNCSREVLAWQPLPSPYQPKEDES